MVKIINGIASYCRKKSICGFLSLRYLYAECHLLDESVCLTVELNSKCPIKNNIYIGNMWWNSWKPLGFERSIVYA